MTVAPNWTEAEDRLLWRLREDEGAEWPAITRQLGRTEAACAMRLSKLRKARRGRGVATSAVSSIRVAPPQTATPRLVTAPLKVVRAVDHDILERIAERGLTAGVFGDPPMGASALDKRGAR